MLEFGVRIRVKSVHDNKVVINIEYLDVDGNTVIKSEDIPPLGVGDGILLDRSYRVNVSQ